MSENLVLTHNSIELYEQIFNNNNDPKNTERLKWMHENNPLKKRYFSVYLDTVLNRPAALYAVFPVIFKSFGKKVNAVQSIDTITDVNYRGMGLFKKLAVDCYNNAKNDGMAFVYGFPNDQSAPGFFKSLGWKPIAEVPFLIKPINIFYPLKYKLKKNIPLYINLNLGLKWFFSGNKSKYIAKDIILFDEQYDALWNKYSATFKNCVERKYIVKSFSIADKLIAVFVLSIKEDKHNGKIGYIIDTIFDPDYSADMDYLFHHAIKKTFYAARADMILAWCFDYSQNYSLYSKNGFFKLPPRLQPIKLFFGACNFINKDDDQFFDKKNWYLSYCDSDTV
jgi:Acetyltransferase (GNAT) domain